METNDHGQELVRLKEALMDLRAYIAQMLDQLDNIQDAERFVEEIKRRLESRQQ